MFFKEKETKKTPLNEIEPDKDYDSMLLNSIVSRA